MNEIRLATVGGKIEKEIATLALAMTGGGDCHACARNDGRGRLPRLRLAMTGGGGSG